MSSDSNSIFPPHLESRGQTSSDLCLFDVQMHQISTREYYGMHSLKKLCTKSFLYRSKIGINAFIESGLCIGGGLYVE